MNQKGSYQPEDTGKLTNFHYGTQKDKRKPGAAPENTKGMKSK